MSEINYLKNLVIEMDVMEYLSPHYGLFTDNASMAKRLVNKFVKQELIQLAEFISTGGGEHLTVFINKNGLHIAYDESNKQGISEKMAASGTRLANAMRIY